MQINSNPILAFLVTLIFISIPLSALAAKNNYTTEKLSLNQDDIHGLWIEKRKKKLAVWIEDCGNTLCGSIYWMKKPLDKKGQPKLDPHNPDTKLRNRPRCGMKILSGFVKNKENHWKEGKIYNPDNGSTYSSKIELSKSGILKVRGFIGLSLFGKTLKWERPEQKLQHCG